MWLMLQQDKPDDYLVATGRSTSVEEMYKIAFKSVGLNAEDHVVTDKQFVRPRSTFSSAIRRRPRPHSDGRQKSRWKS